MFVLAAVVISSVSAARRHAEQNLRDALRELSQLDRAKDEFVAVLSHELRTPLTAILGWLHLLRSDRNGPVGDEAIVNIERGAQAQAHLIDDLLDASRIVVGKFHVERKPVVVQSFVNQAVELIRPSAASKGIALEAHLDEQPITITGDASRLNQAVWNFLTNSIKFTPAGGAISVSVDRSDTAAMIRVHDTGDGIDPELLPQIFARFKQAEGAERKGGLGLGLSIVQHIVEMHGGRVTAESAGKGQGATFTIVLPRADSSPLGLAGARS